MITILDFKTKEINKNHKRNIIIFFNIKEIPRKIKTKRQIKKQSRGWTFTSSSASPRRSSTKTRRVQVTVAFGEQLVAPNKNKTKK